ncbi:MAG: class I tRNA ligase family protein, partial [Deltaproteobacteria bacterium]|nr:class I tRNA ligase family protein [Deltaproteobacteria bacterium]
IRFPVKGEDRTSFLAWTTTPWTLPSNIALAVDAKTDYATVEVEGGERLILAAALVGKVLGDDVKGGARRHELRAAVPLRRARRRPCVAGRRCGLRLSRQRLRPRSSRAGLRRRRLPRLQGKGHGVSSASEARRDIP